MAKTEIRIGCYTESRSCAKCGWLSSPLDVMRPVCPACGGSLTRKVGRYKRTVTTSLMGFETEGRLEFIEGVDASEVPPCE